MALLFGSQRDKRLYSLQDDLAIIKGISEGKPASEVAVELGRSLFSLRYRVRWLQQTKMETVEQLESYHKKEAERTVVVAPQVEARVVATLMGPPPSPVVNLQLDRSTKVEDLMGTPVRDDPAASAPKAKKSSKKAKGKGKKKKA